MAWSGSAWLGVMGRVGLALREIRFASFASASGVGILASLAAVICSEGLSEDNEGSDCCNEDDEDEDGVVITAVMMIIMVTVIIIMFMISTIIIFMTFAAVMMMIKIVLVMVAPVNLDIKCNSPFLPGRK